MNNGITTDTRFDVNAIRAQFPLLHQQIGKNPLVYFDNAATTQKPKSVIRALTEYYEGYNANIHRGAHYLADKATRIFESTREKARQYINAESPSQIIFTRGTTEGINLVASGLAQSLLKPGDEILITGMEHHSNIVPWQMACERTGAVLKVIPVLQDGTLDLGKAEQLLTERTKVFSLVYISNSLGTVNPAKELLAKAKSVGAITVLDAAQAVGHFSPDVQDLTCDFMVFSGHKMFGPTGIGILYGTTRALEDLPPYQGGGEMIKEVTFEKTTYNELPFKFEAGTPNIADGIALGAAFDFLQNLDRPAAANHEADLLEYGTQLLIDIPEVQMIGTAPDKVPVLSFVTTTAHPADIGTLLDQYGIAVRTGHHCCQPLMNRFEIPGTVRASLSLYNTREELDIFADRLRKVIRMLT